MQPPLLAAPLLLLLLSTAAAAPSASSDAAALLVFKTEADPGHRLTSFNASSTSHCVWPGVACSAAGRVVRLVIEHAGLTGFLAGGGLDRLDQLRVLSLKTNSLAGPIPDLSSLRNIKALFLAGNRLGGPFPSSLLSLRRLRILDLSDNHLAGLIPPSIAGLDRLYALRVDSNRFDGPFPALNQSTLKILNVSHNNFSGAIPSTAALSAFGPSAFAANPLLCGEAVGRACPEHFLFFPGAAPSPADAAARKREAIRLPSSPPRRIHKRAIVVAAFVVGALLVIGVLFVFLAMQRRRQRRRMEKKGVAPSGESVVLESYRREIESGNSELMAAAAVAMSEEKVRKLGKSGCLVFCAGEVQVFTLEQLMKRW